MIQSILKYANNKVNNITSAQLAETNKNFVWVDVEDPSKEDFDFLKKHFLIHSLACDQIFDSNLRPKLQDFENHLAITFHEPVQEDKSFFFSRLDIFIGKNFIITLHQGSLPSIDAIKENLSKNPNILKKGPSFMTYTIIDTIVENYFPVLDELDSLADEIEDKVFINYGDKETLKRIFYLKRRLIEFRKRISPEREILSTLSRTDSKIIDSKYSIYFRDIYDHLIRISDMVDIYRDLVTSVLDVYVSVQSNKLNEVMKVLTVIATIMMPLTLITGFYGMNVSFPEIDFFGAYTYYFIFVLMLIVSILLILFFKKKKWL